MQKDESEETMTETQSKHGDKLAAALCKFDDALAIATEANKGGVILALANATKALKRIAARAGDNLAPFERVELVQKSGPTLEFTGKLIAETSFTPDVGINGISLEIWETSSGAWIASAYYGRDESAAATVVPPHPDYQAMQFAVMDHFGWSNRARSMVRKQLGWSLVMDVE